MMEIFATVATLLMLYGYNCYERAPKIIQWKLDRIFSALTFLSVLLLTADLALSEYEQNGKIFTTKNDTLCYLGFVLLGSAAGVSFRDSNRKLREGNRH